MIICLTDKIASLLQHRLLSSKEWKVFCQVKKKLKFSFMVKLKVFVGTPVKFKWLLWILCKLGTWQMFGHRTPPFNCIRPFPASPYKPPMSWQHQLLSLFRISMMATATRGMMPHASLQQQSWHEALCKAKTFMRSHQCWRRKAGRGCQVPSECQMQ